MFKCEICNLPSKPGTKPTFVTVETREAEYTNQKETVVGWKVEKETVFSKGTEIVSEGRVCFPCATGKPYPDIAYDPAKAVNVAGVKQLHRHSGTCDGFRTTRDRDGNKVKVACEVCAKNMEWIKSIPLHHLTEALSEGPTERATFQLATLIVESTFEKGTQRSKRSELDKAAGMRLLQDYQNMGGKLRS